MHEVEKVQKGSNTLFLTHWTNAEIVWYFKSSRFMFIANNNILFQSSAYSTVSCYFYKYLFNDGCRYTMI